MKRKFNLVSILLSLLLTAAALFGGTAAKAASASSNVFVLNLNSVDEPAEADNNEYVYAYNGSFTRQSDYASSLNMLRVIKNRYYNALDGALGEDRTIAHLLYRLFDFVYGDSILDLFTDCFAEDEVFIASLARMGYTDCVITRGENDVTVEASFFGTPRLLTASYNPASDAARLCISQEGSALTIMEWRATAEGYAVQYMRAISPEEFNALYGTGETQTAEPVEEETDEPDEDMTEPEEEPDEPEDNAPEVVKRGGDTSSVGKPDEPAVIDDSIILSSFIGYRAYLRDDGTGSVCHGPFCNIREASIMRTTVFSIGMVPQDMFFYDIYSMTDRQVTFADRTGSLAHELGAVPEKITAVEELEP